MNTTILMKLSTMLFSVALTSAIVAEDFVSWTKKPWTADPPSRVEWRKYCFELAFAKDVIDIAAIQKEFDVQIRKYEHKRDPETLFRIACLSSYFQYYGTFLGKFSVTKEFLTAKLPASYEMHRAFFCAVAGTQNDNQEKINAAFKLARRLLDRDPYDPGVRINMVEYCAWTKEGTIELDVNAQIQALVAEYPHRDEFLNYIACISSYQVSYKNRSRTGYRDRGTEYGLAVINHPQATPGHKTSCKLYIESGKTAKPSGFRPYFRKIGPTERFPPPPKRKI